MGTIQNFAPGTWIVHAFYGIGRIKGLECKQISGDEAEYYKITTADSTFWIPVDQMDSDILRPLSSPEDIQQAITILQRPPQEMSSNYKVRQSRIKETQKENSPKAIARLVRDLRALQKKKGVLNHNESTAFRQLKEQFAREWALVTGSQADKVANRLNKILNLQY